MIYIQIYYHFFMKINNIIKQNLIRDLVLLSAFMVVFLSSTSIIVVIENVQAIAITTSTTSNNSTTTSIGVISYSPFYESNVSKVIGERVISTANGYPRVEQSVLENAIIKVVGNVTNLSTWTSIYKSPTIVYGDGQGVITTADGRDTATWTGYSTGQTSANGVTIYHDIVFFNTNSTGKLAFLNNMVGLRTAEVDGNKQTAKISEWK